MERTEVQTFPRRYGEQCGRLITAVVRIRRDPGLQIFEVEVGSVWDKDLELRLRHEIKLIPGHYRTTLLMPLKS